MKKQFLILTLFILLISGIYAAEVSYFYSPSCSHCANVVESGILEKVKSTDVNVTKYNVVEQEGLDKFLEITNKLNLSRGVPLAVIEKNGETEYLRGDRPIIENLENAVKGEEIENEEGVKNYLESIFIHELDEESGKLSPTGWLILILIALIDAINPCAFGVLIFLMASLLKMGSAKRAMHAGLIYSIVVFATYFLVGLLLYNIISAFAESSFFSYFYIIIAVIIFILGLFQLKDVFWYGKGFTLRIPAKAKPIIESLMNNTSLISILILGILVSLFELPCTGEVYFGILTIMAKHEVFALSYLFVYNLVFVLPLIILTILIAKGVSPEKIQNWTNEKKKYMKLASGLLLLALAIYIFISSVQLL